MAEEPHRILVIEDDQTLVLGLKLNLEAEGFSVIFALDGATGLRFALEHRPELVLLDLTLPELGGFEVLSRLRERGLTMPVIVLSARRELRDKLGGFELGATDYVTKPFSVEELVARIRAALGRTKPSPRLAAGRLELDLTARRLTRGGAEVVLTAREFDLLAYLAARPGRVHPRERLLSAAWGDDYEGTTRTVDNFVRSLRVKLEDDPANPRHLITVRGAGYRFDP